MNRLVLSLTAKERKVDERDYLVLPGLEERTRGHLSPDLLAETVLLLSETQPGRERLQLQSSFADPQIGNTKLAVLFP